MARGCERKNLAAPRPLQGHASKEDRVEVDEGGGQRASHRPYPVSYRTRQHDNTTIPNDKRYLLWPAGHAAPQEKEGRHSEIEIKINNYPNVC